VTNVKDLATNTRIFSSDVILPFTTLLFAVNARRLHKMRA